MTNTPPRDRLVLVFLIIVAVMAVEIVYLIYQNRQLQAMLDNPTQFLRTLQPDQSVPTIRAQDISGGDFELRYGPEQPHTLLVWFSGGCHSCRENFAYWNELQNKYESPLLRFVGFCAGNLDEAQQVRLEHNISFPVLSITDQFLTATYKGNVVPQTVLISPEGIVKQVWPGELLISQREQILTVLNGLPQLAVEGGDQQ